MPPLAQGLMLRPVLVRMPRQALAALSVMGPVMGPATGQGTKGSGLKTAPALELRNNALDPPTFDIATGAGSSIGDCPSRFVDCYSLAKTILILLPLRNFELYSTYHRV